MTFFGELWQFLRVRKKVWLLPVLVVIAVLAALLILGGNPVVAPFIYTLF